MARYDFIAVYILASKRNGTLYRGVTSDLIARISLHPEGQVPGFTQKCGCKALVWHQQFDNMRPTRPVETATHEQHRQQRQKERARHSTRLAAPQMVAKRGSDWNEWHRFFRGTQKGKRIAPKNMLGWRRPIRPRGKSTYA